MTIWLGWINMLKYLIVGPSWVGDMVMAQSLFITLQQRDPGAVIDVLAPALVVTDRGAYATNTRCHPAGTQAWPVGIFCQASFRPFAAH